MVYVAFVEYCLRLHPQRSFCRRAVLSCSSDVVAGGPFFFAVTKISIGCGISSLPLSLQAEPFFFAATEIRIGRGIRCRYGRSRRAIPHCCDDGAAVIRKSGPEIKNRCTQEGVNGEKLTSIRKSGLEIKNRCMKDGGNRQNPAVIRKFGLEIKNRCTKQPIFSTLPQQIPQHIPSTSPAHPPARVPSRVDDASCLG